MLILGVLLNLVWTAAQHEQLPGQAVQLLRVAAEDTVDAGIRHMAAITFKNLVKRSWEKSESHESGELMRCPALAVKVAKRVATPGTWSSWGCYLSRMDWRGQPVWPFHF